MEVFKSFGKWHAVHREGVKVYHGSGTSQEKAEKDLRSSIKYNLWVHQDNSVAIMFRP